MLSVERMCASFAKSCTYLTVYITPTLHVSVQWSVEMMHTVLISVYNMGAVTNILSVCSIA